MVDKLWCYSPFLKGIYLGNLYLKHIIVQYSPTRLKTVFVFEMLAQAVNAFETHAKHAHTASGGSRREASVSALLILYYILVFLVPNMRSMKKKEVIENKIITHTFQLSCKADNVWFYNDVQFFRQCIKILSS